MNKSGRSVLWFLGGTLSLIEAVIGIAAGFSDASAETVLLYSVIALASVLAALVSMYLRDPVFLMTEGEHVVPLTVVRELADKFDPSLVRTLLHSISPEALKGRGPDIEEEEPEGSEAEDEVVDYVDEEDDASADEKSELEAHLDDFYKDHLEKDS